MDKFILLFLSCLGFCAACSSDQSTQETKDLSSNTEVKAINLLTDILPIHEDGDVNAIIEIPAGSIEKWELNKTTGRVEREFVNGSPRIIQYLGYPGNYGMIPQTLLSKENGGDGDPLDILVLGAPVEQSSILKSKIIGVLYLLDRGEQDDKLIAVSEGSPFYEVNSMQELDERFSGVSAMVKTWFSNYKGHGKMVTNGFGEKDAAMTILETSIKEYNLDH